MTAINKKKQLRIGVGIGIINLLFIMISSILNHLFRDSEWVNYNLIGFMMLIFIVGFYLIYKFLPSDKRFALLIIPITLLILALFTYLFL